MFNNQFDGFGAVCIASIVGVKVRRTDFFIKADVSDFGAVSNFCLYSKE